MVDMSEDIVWMDMEMTGLNINEDKILEIACIITDKQLIVKANAGNIVINWPEQVLQNMNEWCQIHHKKSNLIDECLKSQIDIKQAEEIVFKFLQKHIPKSQCPLAGNSIYIDRLFLKSQMPAIDDYLHYRLIDVSTIKELIKRWRPDIMKSAPLKRCAHRCLPDIEDSIEELKYYKSNFLNILP